MRLIERRIGFLFAVFLALLLIGGFKAAWLGVVKAGTLKHAASTQQKADITVPARRGTIFDRGGTELAVSQPAVTIAVTPYLIKDPGGLAARLSPLLDKPEDELLKVFARRDTGFAYLARRVPPARARRIQRMEIEGLEFIPEFERNYPRDWMASQLLGVTGTDHQGLSGIEYSLDEHLRGRDGERKLTKDALGDAIQLRETQRTVPGTDVRLTLDAAIQESAEDVLADVGAELKPKGATAIVMDPRDGAILALANWPQVNANAPGDAPDYARQNRAIGATYEPGSTFKAFTVSGALEEHLVTADTSFNLPPTIKVADREIGESHPVGYRTLTTAGILKESSNVGAIMIGQRLGATEFDKWVRRFGFGKPTGIDLPGEERGIVLDVKNYSGASMGNLPIGQGIAVTPMQMATAYAAIANGGILRPPHIVEDVGTREARKPKGHRIMSEHHRRVAAPDARRRVRPGRHRLGRGHRRLRARRQDRHGGEAGRVRRLLEDEVRVLVRRLRTRAAPEAARGRDGRRAAGRHLRRHGRGARVPEDHELRAAVPADPAGLTHTTAEP